MSSTIRKGLRFSSPLKLEEETKVIIEKQGIVSILGSDCDQTKAASLRRTLSADMSSKKWLAQHGFSFSPMKKIASSEELSISVPDSSSSSSSSEEGEYEGKKELEKPSQSDSWISILSKKPNEDSSKLPPPYIHPLVKRSASSLSEKSLEICTESLGSETGSDGFSSYASSETGDVEEDREEAQPKLDSQFQFFGREELRLVKKNSPKSFPPPIPSLASCDGPKIHMHPHRESGRLVLEAVSVPSQKYFHAQRQDGRLVLTLANSPSSEPSHEEVLDQEELDEVEEIEEVFGSTFEGEKDYEEEEEEEEMEEVENGIVMEQGSKLASGVINVHRSAQMMKKLMGLYNRNPTWTTNKFNKGVNLVEMELDLEEEEGPTPLAQSLPRPPRVARLIASPSATAAAASFNAYDYFWRTKPSVINLITPQCPPLKNNSNKVILSNSPKAYEKQEMVLFRGNKADYLVPLFRGCKESRRSLLIREPYCIATS